MNRPRCVGRRGLGGQGGHDRAGGHLAQRVDDGADQDDDHAGRHRQRAGGVQQDEGDRGEDDRGMQHPPPGDAGHRPDHQALADADHHGVDHEDRAGHPARQVEGVHEVDRHGDVEGRLGQGVAEDHHDQPAVAAVGERDPPAPVRAAGARLAGGDAPPPATPSISRNAATYDAALSSTTDWKAASEPIVSATAASTPPTP